MKFTPTPEQQSALDAFAAGGSLRLVAGAGTGKTSTLRLLAESEPRTSFLYIAYNRAIADDAKKAFPRNTRVMTSHGLAYATVGRAYSQRLNGPRVTAQRTAHLLGIRGTITIGDRSPLQPVTQASYVTAMINRYCASADTDLGAHHMPETAGFPGTARTDLGAALLPYARKAWADLTALDGNLRFTHDVYLKLFALTRPDLGADVIAYDEVQDATPVTAAMVLDQQKHGTRVVAVGDSSQAIYGWRGAIDSMTLFAADHEVRLSRSFRFGPVIATEANKWLTLIGAPLRLTGHPPVGSKVGTLTDADAILCRTNSGALAEVIAVQDAGRTVGIVGGGRDLKALAEGARDLKTGKGTAHPELAAFTSWSEVQDYSDTADGADLRPLVNLIDEHTPDGVLAALARCVDEYDAQTVVSTAHKAKGREWDRVRIAEDFTPPDGDDDPSTDEAMLAYVAVTRARKVLDRGALSWIDRYVKDGAIAAPEAGTTAAPVVAVPTPVAVPTVPAMGTPGADTPAPALGRWAASPAITGDMRPVTATLIGPAAIAVRAAAAAAGITPAQWITQCAQQALTDSRAIA